MRNTKEKKETKKDVKKRIQKLLTLIVRIRDGGCVFRNYPLAGECKGFTMADHVNSRKYANTFADLRNVVCACLRHHMYWKPENPVDYAELVKEIMGEETYQLMRALSRFEADFSVEDWLKIEEDLKEKYEKIKRRENSWQLENRPDNL